MKQFDFSQVRSYKLYHVLKPVAKVVVKVLYRAEYVGVENIPKDGGFIIASNHVSFFDPVIIGAGAARRIHCMAKAELFEKPFLGWFFTHLNAFPVKRGKSDKASVEYAVKAVNEGEVLGIFPEGTRSKDYKPGTAKAGVALIAKATGADVLPVSVYSGEKKLSPFKTKVVVRFGEVIKHEELSMEKGTSAELREASEAYYVKDNRALGGRILQIKVAETAGFCFGVNRAVDMIYKMLDEGKKVATLGPIIHNDSVVNDLKARGAIICSAPEEVPDDCTLVIRTHGVGEDIIKRAEKCKGGYVNATCPFVLKIHKIVKAEREKGRIILIAGDPKHPEVEGINGHCGNEAFIFENADSLDKIMALHPEFSEKEVSVVSQTTFSVKEWEKCVKKINLVYTNAIVFDTICNATEERQLDAAQLSKECDLMVVVGGRSSSNTAKLVSVCSERCKTYHVETAAELSELQFTGTDKIGVTAGASTPACIIKEVLQTMSEILENKEVIADAENTKEEAVSMDEMSFSEALEESLKNLTTDQIVKGEVVGIAPNEIQVDIGRKHAGYVPLSELTNDPTLSTSDVVKVGDVVDLMIMKTNDAEGTVMLSKRRYDAISAWDEIVKASEDGTILEGTVTDVIKGGVLVVSGALRVFIPASLATASRGEALENLLKTKVRFKVIEVNKQRRRAVGSIKAVLKEERKAAEEAFWAEAEEGRTYTGTVKSLTSYGAFVDIGGVDGMIHISELSWSRIKHPSEVVNVGDTVEVYIKALDTENKKISLGYKKVEDNPWEILRRDYPEGTVVDAKIVGLTAFGAFAQVIPGIDGLIHISQLSTEHVEKPQDVVKAGDEVKVMITKIDFDKKRVSLSMKEAMAPAAEEAEADAE